MHSIPGWHGTHRPSHEGRTESIASQMNLSLGSQLPVQGYQLELQWLGLRASDDWQFVVLHK